MKFLVDAQLPHRVCDLLTAEGHDALHTLDLPNGNRTTDAEINTISIQEHRVVITKDSDFVDSFLLSKKPYKLLLISAGNISNKDLDALFLPLIPTLVTTFQSNDYAELSRTSLIVHA